MCACGDLDPSYVCQQHRGTSEDPLVRDGIVAEPKTTADHERDAAYTAAREQLGRTLGLIR